MSYRSLKRVLGETSLERKCRLLFGACLFLLILGSFSWYGLSTENLINEKNADTGRRLVDAAMLKFHWLNWETVEERKGFVQRTSDDLENLNYEWRFLALDNPDQKPYVYPPAEEEAEILRQLAAEYEKQLKEESQEAPPSDAEPPPAGEAKPKEEEEFDPVFAQRRVGGEFLYYQPVYWKQTCRSCHQSLHGVGALSAADAGDFDSQPPFRVVKVAIPDQEIQEAITYNRAILLATAIITVFLAMVALYAIVKYIIVKPLKHLRDVSDEISRGNTGLRADLHTNDEFEDLAASFNRMLRHLVDTQEELRNVNNDLDGKVDELAQANLQLYEMNRLKSEFLANMSHELRTPLNSIIGFSDVLRDIDQLNNKQRRYAENIQKSGRVLLEMINDILDLAKMEAGKMEVRPSEFSITSIVRAQCDMVRSLTEEKNIDLDVRADEGLPPMYQDQSKVQQILTNLLSNAIKFTPEGGRITVDIRQDTMGRLELTVEDTGVGIAEEDREIIFEKFRQGVRLQMGDNLTREFSGTGLGLSIVKELCKLLGGEVSFTSQLGQGSAFTIVLPWTRADAAQRDAAQSAALSKLTGPRHDDYLAPKPTLQGAVASDGEASE